jgi:S1-C subfamily serine protease
MAIRRDRSDRSTAGGVLGLLLFITFLASCSAPQTGMAAERFREARCSEPIPDIFSRVSPAVVSITATSINPYQVVDRVTRAVGSGVIIDPSGLILTNSHMAFGRHSITVTLDDGTSVPAQLVGADPIFDLAVVRVPLPAEGALVPAALGDSDAIRVGEEVVAIGNPLGLEQSLTRGVVSAINRILPEIPFSLQEPMIQTDTPINPGNSGGPLLNRCGEVVGIMTAVIQDAQNIGFAIPINLVKAVLPSLVAEGRIIRPWLGFHGQLVGTPLRDLLRIPLVEGLLVEVVEPDSPAEEAGLRGGRLELVISGRSFLIGGDIVTSVNGTPLTSPDKLVEVMRALKVGATVNLTVFGDGEYRTVEYVLPERPLLPGDIPGQRLLAPGAPRGIQRPGPRGAPPG